MPDRFAVISRAYRGAKVCNRYASDIRKAGVERDYYGFEEWSETRLNVVLEVFPKSIGPIIRLDAGGNREWSRMRWGLPGPQSTGGAPVTNIRNIKSPALATAAWPRAPMSCALHSIQRVRGRFAERREDHPLVCASQSRHVCLRGDMANLER